ncbi:MAG: hypothetical protein ACR2J3_09380 [Aridibacter sp.]
MKNPIHEWTEENPVDNWDESQGDRHLDFDFDYDDFTVLHNYLNLQLPIAEQQKNEDYAEFEERLKNEHIEAAKERGYEMLGRIWYWYETVSYLPSEINQLFEECLKLKNNAQNTAQAKAMDKLITACNEANTTNSGIFLASD